MKSKGHEGVIHLLLNDKHRNGNEGDLFTVLFSATPRKGKQKGKGFTLGMKRGAEAGLIHFVGQ